MEDLFDDDEEEWDDDFDWDDLEDEEPKVIKSKRKRKYPSKRGKYPTFDWDSLTCSETSGLRDCIRAAEKKMVPDDGLQFSYASVDFINMSEVNLDYLKELQDEADRRCRHDDSPYSHDLYFTYLIEIIDWFIKQ